MSSTSVDGLDNGMDATSRQLDGSNDARDNETIEGACSHGSSIV